MEDLLAFYREQTREDTFGETSTEHDDLRTVSGEHGGQCAAGKLDVTSYSSSMVY